VTAEEETLVVRLDDKTVERLARRVAELLDHPPSRSRNGPQRLLSAAQVSAWCGVDRSWVYEHADELGALRLGTGPKPRLRFDPERVAARLSPPTAAPPADPPVPRHSRRFRAVPGDSGDLLPLRGDPELSSTRPSNGRPGGAPTPPATAPKTSPPAR
jgi:hypothetical protein